jgi:hypothetical protein
VTHRALFRFSWSPVLLAAAAAALVLGGCQAMFTYSPLSGFQRPPSSMTPAQRLTYAQDALASGNTASMKAAYDAIKNDPGADAQYVAAQLGIELSGIPDVLLKIASDPSSATTELTSIDSFIASHNLDPSYIVAAAGQLAAAQAGGKTLTNMDMAMGAVGLLLGGAQSTNGNWDISVMGGTASQTAALAFLAPAVADVASLPSGDPMKDFITQLNAFVTSP